MGWLSIYFAGGGLPPWMTNISRCFAAERKTGKKQKSPHANEVRLLYDNQPQPGQPFRIDFDGGFTSVGKNPRLGSHTRFPVSTSSSRTNLVLGDYTNSPFGSAIPTDARSIGASSQCSGKSRRRKRLQRKRRPYLTDIEMSVSSTTWDAAHLRQDMRAPFSHSESGTHTGTHPPKFPKFIQQTAKATPRPPAISFPIKRSTTPPQRHPSDCSRYTISRHNSNGSDNAPRPSSMYHKAVLALPRNTEYFLESLDNDLPAPLVPLKIRPLFKAPLVPRRQVSKKRFQSRQSEDLDFVREWDQGWEDFNTMLDDYQKSFNDEGHNALCAPRSYDLPETSMSASALEQWRSRWSDDSSEMSSTQYKEVILPPLAHLPDLESDSSDGVSNSSSPTSRGPNTPYLQTSFSPFHDSNASKSHISLCLAESRTPISPRHHGGSHSLDSAQSKRLPHEAKHKQSASVSTCFPPDRHNAAAKTLEGSFDVSIVQAEETALPRYLEMHRRGGYEDLKHWPTREEFGTPF